MGDYAGCPQHRALQTRQGCGALLPRQGQGAPSDHQHQQHQRRPRKCVRASIHPSLYQLKKNPILIVYSGQVNYSVAKAGVVGLTKTIAKEWGPQFGVRANTIAFGYITTRLTAAKEDGTYFTTSDGTKVALGIPRKGKTDNSYQDGAEPYADIPLRRPGSAEEAARAIVGVASPYFSYVNGETIRVTGGRNM